VDWRLQKLEKANQNLVVDLVSILKSMNSNIQNLTEVTYLKNVLRSEDGKDQRPGNTGNEVILNNDKE
jgi:hypothetical protein